MVAMFTERKTPCPLSRAALEQKKGSFTCPDITEVYHCLQDERNRSGEICHQPIWVPKDYCPQYNTGGKAITTVTCTSSIGCPDVRFWSNEVYKYPVCLNKTNKNYGGGIPEGKENNPLSPLSEGKESSPVSPWIFVGIAIAVVLAAVCCIVCCIIRRKQKKNKHASELELLPVENEIPLSFKKAIDYVKGHVFSTNRGYGLGISILDNYNCIAIIGPPGSGKTITAVQLAYRKCELSKLFFCQTVEEILDTAEMHKGVYIIADDWIDKYVYYPYKFDKAIDLLSNVYNKYVRSGELYLILTVQEDIWWRFKGSFEKCGLFQRESLLKIQSLNFTKTEKQNMILCHFKHYNIKVFSDKGQNKSRDNFAANLTKLGNECNFSFPVMIDLICALELVRAQQRILMNGFSNELQNFFDKWLEEGDTNQKRSFCILVFAAFLGGKVSLSDFKCPVSGPLFDKVCNMYKCSFNAGTELIQDKSPDQEIKMLLGENEQLRSCLYQTSCRQNDIVFIFHHSSLFRFVLSYIKEKGEVFFIENVHVEVLLKHCWIVEPQGILDLFLPDFVDEGYPLKQPEGSVSLSTSVIETLAKRIYSEKEKGYCIPEWDDHIFMRRKYFKKFWKKVDHSIQI